MFTELLESYKEKGLKALSTILTTNEEATEDEFNKEVDIAQKKSEGKIRAKKVDDAAVQAVEVESKGKAGGLDESSDDLLYKERHHLEKADNAFIKGDRAAYHNHNRLARIAGKAHREMYGSVYHDLTHMSHDEAEDHLNTSRAIHDGDIVKHPTYGTQVHDKDLGHVEKMNAWKDAALKKSSKLKEDTEVNESDEENKKKSMWGKPSDSNLKKGGRDKKITPEEKEEIHKRVKKSAEEIKKNKHTMKGGKIVSEEEELDERKLTKDELDKRENIVMKLKKKMKDFKARYGDKAKSVAYAVATKQAKK